jgi:hypothetical protein
VTEVAVRKRLFGNIYVVRAEKNGHAEHWAAATLQENAVAAVEAELGPEWKISAVPWLLPGRGPALDSRP